MSGKVTLTIVNGPRQEREFVFEGHDTFVAGRSEDCHVHLPKDDDAVSRHHFLLEVNPPDARIRDLGSRNGTYVNGVKYGGRNDGETAGEAAGRRYSDVDLKHGDEIRAGQTVLRVEVEFAKADTPAVTEPYVQPVRCRRCGKDASREVGNSRRGDYLCQACQRRGREDPVELLRQFLAMCADAPGPPEIKGLDIGETLGRGTFGAVYAARRKTDDAPVAVKLMFSRVAVEEKARQLFLRETGLLKGLCHANVVRFLEHGSAGNAFYLVMEYCNGGSVADLLEQSGGRLSLARAAPIMLQALEGLAYIHGQNVVHRDLKPGNILLAGPNGRQVAKISDLGLSKNFQQAGLSGHTLTGDTGGTPAFMPREQVVNFKYVKPPSDVWSMGATFYHMLTGAYPHDFPHGRDPIQIILQKAIVPIRKRDARIPDRVAEVVDRALAEEPSDRYQNAEEMLNALRSAL